MIPCSIFAKFTSTDEVPDAAEQPCCRAVISVDVSIIPNVLSFESHAITIPVQPTLDVTLVESDVVEDILKAAATPISIAEITKGEDAVDEHITVARLLQSQLLLYDFIYLL